MDTALRKVTRHVSHYLPLVGILVATVIGFYFFPYDKGFQMAIGVAASCGYVSWGLMSHHIHGDLHASVVVEYVSIALLGVVILFFTLFRA